MFWLGIPVMTLWGLAGPSAQGLMSARVSPAEQGQLQGAISSPVSYTHLVQPKLLRALETGEIWPVGANKPETSAARVISAANVDPTGLVAAGKFREDLLYRVDVLQAHLPSLRQRVEDIPAIAATILEPVSYTHLVSSTSAMAVGIPMMTTSIASKRRPASSTRA